MGPPITEPELVETITEEIEAAVEAPVVVFEMPPSTSGRYPALELGAGSGGEPVSAADVWAAVRVVGSHFHDSRLLQKSRSLDVTLAASEMQASISWWDPPDGGTGQVEAVYTNIPYDDAFCELPGLFLLHDTGPGGDFGRIGECNPGLDELFIEDWAGSTGREGLGGLGRLRELRIGGAVDHVSEVPAPDSLESLEVGLAEDTTANREALQARLPGGETAATAGAGAKGAYPIASEHARELVERSIPHGGGTVDPSEE
jgi:hypothetical protein